MCYGIWVEEWYWGNLLLCLPPSCFHMGQFWIGVREGMLWVYWLQLVGGLTTFLWFPPSLFNSFAGVAHSLAIWPHPWHLKHCRALGSFMFWALPRAPVSAWIFLLFWGAVATLLAAEELWVELLWPRPVWPLWELGWVGVFLPSSLSHDPCLGLFRVVAGWVPCSALVRVAINLVIWSPSSFEPSVTSVAVDDLALTFSLASSILLSVFLAATMNWE